MQKPKIFVCLDDEEMIRRITKAQKRIVYAAPSISEEVAFAIGTQTVLCPQIKVDVIVDVDPQTLRLGYGEIGALQYLMRSSIDIRCAPGLKIGVLAVDHRSFVFAPTAKIIQDPESDSPNAINIDPTMTEWLLHAMIPKDLIVERAKREVSCINTSDVSDPEQPGEPPESDSEFDEEITEPEPRIDGGDSSLETSGTWTEPEIGDRIFQTYEMADLVEDVEKRPPKQFDHEREMLVYNGYLRFVQIKFTGGRLSSRTVRLPDNILAMAQDRPEMIEIKATCKLLEEESVLPEVEDFERRLDEVRRCYTKSLGGELGRVVLIRDLEAFENEIQYLTEELDEIRRFSIEKIDSALKERKECLRGMLYRLLFNNPNPDVINWLENTQHPKDQIVSWYLDRALEKVFPEASAMIGKMDLVCIYKDVTWEMLNETRFGDAIKRTFPHEEFTKLYSERNTIGERQPKPPPRDVVEVDDEWPSEIG